MFKRVRWFSMGAAASLAGAWYAKRVAARSRPGQIALRTGTRIADAVREGRLAMDRRQAELEATARDRRTSRAPRGSDAEERRPNEHRAGDDVVSIGQLQRSVRPGARAISMRRATRTGR